ncbi:MAG: alginate lyase family protein, partial [Balneolaceae bacterium]
MLRFRVTFSATGCLLVCLVLFISCSFLEEVKPKFSAENTGPYYLFKPYLNEVQALLDNEDRHLTQAFEKLLERVEEDWLDQKPYSVVDNWQFEKERLSGTGRHDYVSLYSFAWPDPESPGEFIIKDGQRNPEVDKYDRVPLAKMSKAVEDLSVAYYLTGDSLYAKKTAEFVKTWFLNEETHMNPHFEFTQINPGEDTGRGLQGIVEARDFIPVIEGVSLIYESTYWTEDDHLKLKKWFHDFLRWIIRNYNADAFDNALVRNGQTYGSNIATWLDAQKTIYALFTEQEDLLNSRQILPLSESVKNRIDIHGSQPNELERGTPQHYTYFNMKGLILQAEMR